MELALASRAFLRRVVTYLAGEAGIRQFLDIGTGLPTADNTHEVAQRVAPESRIVYVDNDPLVLVHARALLTSDPHGATYYLDADVRQPDSIIAAAGDFLDFTQPVGLMLMGILGHVREIEQARSIVARLLSPLASGSYLAVCDSTDVVDPEGIRQAQDAYNDSGAVPYYLRSPEQVASFFTGLDLVDPGVVSCSRWHPATGELPSEVDQFGGVARKP